MHSWILGFSMKLFYAKMYVRKWIRYNYGKYDGMTFNSKLNWAVVNLSHRVCKLHGTRGHAIRQKIRKTLWAYAKVEIRRYQPSITNRLIGFLRAIFH